MKLFAGILTMAILMASARAQTPAQPPKSTPIPTPALRGAKHVPLTYKPPKNAAAVPRKDVDAGSRGWVAGMPSLYVLAPNHVGLTTHGQPSLFWYQSGPASTRIELTIVEPRKAKPLLRVGADKADQGGVHRIPLERYNITLAPGVVYKWTVALVPSSANRSQDVIASGTIQRIEPDAPLKSALAGSKGQDTAAVYAAQGIWYDALESVADEINASPKNRDVRLQRASLLDQAGLKDAATSDRK